MLYRNKQSHNPYFSRWFSAININIENWARLKAVTILILVDGFLQSDKKTTFAHEYVRHNPYFSRWFSAIILIIGGIREILVTILILVDGFLQ